MRKEFNKRIRRQKDGVQLAADINAVVAVNDGEQGTSSVSSRSTTRVVQRSGGAGKEQRDKEER